MAAEEPTIIRAKDEMRKWSRAMKAQGKVIGFVPTMGYLHNGHLSLINEARKCADLIVVSIYVNPAQFAVSEDFSTYPIDLNGDLKKLMTISGGVDVVFNPFDLYDYGSGEVREITCRRESVGEVSCLEDRGSEHETWIRVDKLEKGLCGKTRPLFFRGVATVVSKLFNIVEPDVAVFGKKDYQQWRIICRLVRDLDFGIQIIGAEIMREDDGLAMSSRNVYLSPEERQKALSINKSLFKAKVAAERGQICSKELRDSVIRGIEEAGGKVDYAEILNQETLEVVEEINIPVVFCVAAWFGKTRLLDNLEINL